MSEWIAYLLALRQACELVDIKTYVLAKSLPIREFTHIAEVFVELTRNVLLSQFWGPRGSIWSMLSLARSLVIRSKWDISAPISDT